MAVSWETYFVQWREVCVRERARERERDTQAGNVRRTDMNKARCKSFFSALDHALLISETFTSHPSLVFFFQTIMEQFNPCLRNFVAMGKNYEKALASKYFFPSFIFSVLPVSLHVQAQSQGSTLPVSFSFSPSPCKYLSTYLSVGLTKGQYLSPCQGQVLSCGVYCFYGRYIQRNTKRL